jgi:hypothetical protein
MFDEEREVLGGELVLERLGGGGDHRASTRDDRRNEVGEGLAGPGARLDDEMSTIGDGTRHGLRHLDLPGARFAGGECGGDRFECPGGVGDEPIGGCHWRADGTGGVGCQR